MSAGHARAVRAYFDRAVEEWDTQRYLDQTYVGRARHALRWLRALGSGKRVLDLGCGTGRQSVAALRAGDRVVSTDFSWEMAHATRERIRRECPGAAPAVVVSDAQHPPFRPGSFDAVMALGVVGFVPDRPRMLRQARALLRPGGTLVCDVGVPEPRVLFPWLTSSLCAPFRAAVRLWRARVRRIPANAAHPPEGWYRAHFVKHAPEEIEQMLRGAGLRPVARGGSGLGDLRVGGREVLPWRVRAGLTRMLGALSGWPGGGWMARRSLTYVVRSVRVEGEDASASAVPSRPAAAHAFPAAPLHADAPALRRQLRG